MSVNGVGTLNESIAVGDFAVPNDFIDLAFAEDRSYLMQRPAGVFVRMNPPFCPALSNSVSAALEKANARTHRNVVYASMQGPRIETPAEVRMLKTLGADIVSMRVCAEAALCRELELCYAALCFVLNDGEGTIDTRPGSSFDALKRKFDQVDINRKMTTAISKVLKTYRYENDECSCGDALGDLRRKGECKPATALAIEGLGRHARGG